MAEITDINQKKTAEEDKIIMEAFEHGSNSFLTVFNAWLAWARRNHPERAESLNEALDNKKLYLRFVVDINVIGFADMKVFTQLPPDEGVEEIFNLSGKFPPIC